MAQGTMEAGTTEALLKLAVKTVDDQLGREQKYPELGDFFSTEFSTEYVPSDPRQQFLYRKRAITLPDSIFEQYNLMQCRCFMGLFPEINRVWITIDHRLFLWNYADGGDFESYQELDQVIVNVALVKPKADTFDDKVKYLLVIATPIDVHLLGLSAGSGSTPHTLYITNMSVPTDNVAMRSIVGTEDGRIFMNGNDGRLWEIDYQAEEGWFSKKCSKREIIGSPLSYFMPTFLSKIRVDPIVKVVYDFSRQIMYGLTENSNIEVVALAGSAAPRATIKASNILQEAKRKSNHHRTMDDVSFKIVDIHTITTAEAKDISLLAVTATGCRLYFGNKLSMDYMHRQTDQSPAVPYLLHVRLPPMFEAVFDANGNYRLHQSLYSNGVFLAAHSLSDAVDILIGTAPDSGPINQASTANQAPGSIRIPKLTEKAVLTALEGKIWAMSESPAVEYAGPVDSSIYNNELAVQLSRAPREYLVLTNAGVNVYTKRRPIDNLQQILLDARSTEGDINQFVDQYGRVEACAMCIALICGHPSLSPVVAGSQRPIKTGGERLLLMWGGKPQVAVAPTNQRFTTANIAGSELGRPVSQGGLGQFTYRHSGLSLYLARILRPIWKRKVIKVTNVTRGLIDSEVSDLILTSVQKDLFALRTFLDGSIDLFMPTPVVSSNPPGENDQIEIENAHAEAKSLRALMLLLTQCIEGIAFVLFLVDSKMSDTVKNIPVESQEALLGATYEALLTTPKGHDLCRELVTAVINKQMGHHMSVDAVSDTLRRICGSFCNPNDVIFYKATEHLRLAKSLQDPVDIEDNAREALRLFKRAPFLLVDESHGHYKLMGICKELMELNFFAGAMELALSCAQQVDPGNKAIGYVKDKQNPKDPRQEQYNQRERCYACAFAVLKELGLDSAQGPLSSVAFHTLDTALQFDDSLFHTGLYEWLLRNGRTDHLLEITSPYIEEFLKECRNLDAAKDLLWRYYIRADDYAHAALELGNIADSSLYDLDFESRLEYLSLAVSNAKSYPAGSDPRTDSGRLLIELEEKLEVGNIQLDVILSLQGMVNRENRRGQDPTLSPADRQVAKERAQELEQYLAGCKSRLLDVNNLYHEIVGPLQMFEAMLAIYHTSDIDDEYHVRAAWGGFISRVFVEAEEASRSPLTDIEVRVKELGRRFYPSAKVTPISTLVQILERYPYLRETAHYAVSPGWAVRVLREIGFPYEALFDSFHALIETKKNEWIGPRASLVLIQDIEFLLRVWLAETHGSGIITELNNELSIVEDEWRIYGSPLGGMTGRGGAGGAGVGSMDRYRVRKVDEAIQIYIRILESASWTPTPIATVFDENMGGPQAKLAGKAAGLVKRLKAIQARIQRM